MSDFTEIIKKSFLKSLETHSRSNEKLKILHGAIAMDLSKKLGKEYEVKSLGFNSGKEVSIKGRYMDKNVDITILKKMKAIAGVAVKFVMSNYRQNSNNYFENMLGETANLRANRVPYFQVFIIPDKIPYYDKDGIITRWETITENNIQKYINMSNDSIDSYFHTPNKLLFMLISLGDFRENHPKTADEFSNYYLNNEFRVHLSTQDFNFNEQTIFNNYEEFLDKVYHLIKSI